MKVLNFIKKELPLFIILSMVAGIIKGHYYPMEFSTIICLSALLVMIYPVMINLRIEDGLSFKGAGKPILFSLLINFIISPLLAIGLTKVFFMGSENAKYIAIGLFLISLIPTSGMTLNWVHNLKANMHTGIVLVVVNIIAAFLFVPIVLPLLVNKFLGLQIDAINPMLILSKLAYVIVMPMVMGYITRLIFKALKKDDKLKAAKPLLGGIANVGLLYVMFLIMSLRSTQVLVDHPVDTIKTIIPIFIYYLLMLAIVLPLVRKLFTKDQGFPAFFATYLRYHIISLGIALAAFTENGDAAHGTWVLLPIMAALLIQPLFTSILAKSHLNELTFAGDKEEELQVVPEEA